MNDFREKCEIIDTLSGWNSVLSKLNPVKLTLLNELQGMVSSLFSQAQLCIIWVVDIYHLIFTLIRHSQCCSLCSPVMKEVDVSCSVSGGGC